MVDITRGEQFEPGFLAISPNNRMPEIVDPDGPDGAPISVFESGAILQCLAAKTGRFGGETAREKIAVSEWLFWQVGGLGPMAGQAHRFRNDAAERIPSAIERCADEANRRFGVTDKRLQDHEFLAGSYSIADIACVGGAAGWKRAGQEISEFPSLSRWLDTLLKRPAAAKGVALDDPNREKIDLASDEERATRSLASARRC